MLEKVIIVIGLIILAGFIYALILGLCKTAAPQTDEEQRRDDEEQMEYLRSLNEKSTWN